MSFESKGRQVQAEYADKRKRALNKRDEEKIELVKNRIVKLATKNNVWLEKLATRDIPGWQVAYNEIIRNLQGAQLTINLSAESWFGEDSKRYPTYATTYEKNIVKPGEKSVLKTQYKADGTVSEDANFRLFADQKVTLPEKWKKASLLHPQRRRIYKAMSTTGGKGLGDLEEVDIGNGKVGYQIDNRNFNPYAKQVFAALNFGSRPHGSSINYGYSHLVLKPELKYKAIYFPGDTFAVAVAQNSVSRQCSFETLGAVLAYCAESMANDIWLSCYRKQGAADTADVYLLLEAHIFQEVKLDQHVEALYLSRRVKNGELAADVWATVKENAKSWCKDNNVRLIWMSA